MNSTGFRSISESSSLSEAGRIMAAYNCDRLVVIPDSGAGRGVITAVALVGVLVSGIDPETQLKSVGDLLADEDQLNELDNLDRELKKAQELNRELEAVIESSFDGIGVISGDGTVLRVNTSYERITGLAHEDNGVGRNVYDLEKEGHVSTAVALMVLQQQKTLTIKQKIKTGKEILITGVPVFSEKGQISRVVCNIRDMTELNSLKSQVENTKNISDRYYRELRELRARQVEHGEVIAYSPQMKEVLELAQRVALVNSNILINGESGVGKEIIAKIIHKTSSRCSEAFMQINCGAIPDNLLESELFGYEEGAFTGARAGGKMGFFELCHLGTLLLDEIGELPLPLQVKLLRAIQEQEIFRIGGTKPHKLNVRILAATNKNLEEMVENRSFRKDLFYRLNVVPIYIPPLRERYQDIVPLTIHFLEKYNLKHQTNKRFEPELYRVFEKYDWPGNVRELENVVERLIVTNEDAVLGTGHIAFMGIAKVTNKDKMLISINEPISLKDRGNAGKRTACQDPGAVSEYPQGRPGTGCLTSNRNPQGSEVPDWI
jgi:PAS domain S-box-containing protein